jgi:hypothetical protein
MEYVDGVTLREWVRQPRRLDDMLRVFADAGRGLVAAHAAGLVHRDFKPDNVLMADARPLVSDFGLAQRLDPDATSDVDPAFAGTPAYMAPEQLRGGEACVASDVFSFAVSLYEAVQGRRPFAGDTLRELKDNVLAARTRPWRRAVPRWLKQLLVRALASDPAARPSMAWIVRRIDRHVTRRPVWLLATAAAVIASVVAASLFLRPELECRSDVRRLDGIWDVKVKRKVRAAFLASGARVADERYAAVERTLDNYARAWTDLDQQVCTATRVHHEQSDELYDLRMACLGQRLKELAAFTELLGHGDAGVVGAAANGATRLARLDECSDLAVLSAPVREPKDPAARQKIDAARSLIAGARALMLAGRYAEAQAKATSAVTEARATGYAPVESQALLQLAHDENWREHTDDSKRAYEAAMEAAERGRDDAVRVAAASELVRVLGYQQHRYADAHRYARQATAILERIGGVAGEPVAGLANNIGQLYLAENKLDDAEREMRRALAIREKLDPPNQRLVAEALSNLGVVVGNRGRAEQAIELHRRAATLLEASLGPHHPEVAWAIANMGVAQGLLGRNREALDSAKRALALREAALEPGHLDILGSLNNVGYAQYSVGQYGESAATFERMLPYADKMRPDRRAYVYYNFAQTEGMLGNFSRALELAQQALALRRKQLGPTDYATGDSLQMVGTQLLYLKRFAEAERYLLEALDVMARARGPEHPGLYAVYYYLGELRLAQKRPAEALQVYEHARAIAAAAFGPDNVQIAPMQQGMGRAWLDLHHPERALAPLERAYKLASGPDGTALNAALMAFPLARALWDSGGNRARARKLATDAIPIIERSPSDRDDAARLRVWLAAHK